MLFDFLVLVLEVSFYVFFRGAGGREVIFCLGGGVFVLFVLGEGYLLCFGGVWLLLVGGVMCSRAREGVVRLSKRGMFLVGSETARFTFR